MTVSNGSYPPKSPSYCSTTLNLLHRVTSYLSGTGHGTGSGSPLIVEECQLMLRFALDKGKSIPDGLAKQISQIDARLRQIDRPGITNLPKEIFTPPSSLATPATSADEFDMMAAILSVHGQLSSLVAPATAQTLRVTGGNSKATLFFNLPAVVQLALVTAFVFACLFAYYLPAVQLKTPTPAAEKASQP